MQAGRVGVGGAGGVQWGLSDPTPQMKAAPPCPPIPHPPDDGGRCQGGLGGQGGLQARGRRERQHHAVHRQKARGGAPRDGVGRDGRARHGLRADDARAGAHVPVGWGGWAGAGRGRRGRRKGDMAGSIAAAAAHRRRRTRTSIRAAAHRRRAPPAPPPACVHAAPRLKRIPMDSLPPGKYDEPMGIGTGAGVIFGNTGGVMEAAVGGRGPGGAQGAFVGGRPEGPPGPPPTRARRGRCAHSQGPCCVGAQLRGRRAARRGCAAAGVGMGSARGAKGVLRARERDQLPLQALPQPPIAEALRPTLLSCPSPPSGADGLRGRHWQHPAAPGV
jgi:hypothetical protein